MKAWLNLYRWFASGWSGAAAPAVPAPAPQPQPVEAPRAPLPPEPYPQPPEPPEMQIQDHRLRGAAYVPSPNIGAEIVPRFLIMHYTAGGTARSSVAAIDRAGLSAHFFLDRDGTIIQTVPCNRQAWHAGQSEWNGYSGLNRHSIGIEVCNLGWFDLRSGDGWLRAGLNRVMRPDQVTVAKHKNGGPALAWEMYPEAQLAALDDLTRAILAAYPTIVDVVGHDDVSPGRKVDPGPAFPMARYRAALATA